MGLYEDCKALTKGLDVSRNNGSNKKIVSFGENSESHITVPESVESDARWVPKETVFYISDLHLDHHIIRKFKTGATNEEIQAYIFDVVESLFSGSFLEEVIHFNSPIVLFGGDISSSFIVGEYFYRHFMETWQKLIDNSYHRCRQETESISKKLVEVSRQINECEEKNSRKGNVARSLDKCSAKKVSKDIKKLYERQEALREKLHNKCEELDISYWWEKDYKENCEIKRVYAILGNHELWDFESYTKCVRKYKRLFEEIGIKFLCNDYGWLGRPERFHFLIDDASGKQRTKNNKKYVEEYDRAWLYRNDVLIVGGLGFAALNDKFNADDGIYGNAINREEEKKKGNSWNKVYRKAYETAKNVHCNLVVLSHMPVSDWNENKNKISNCYFFNGHTHQNIAYNEENNSFVFADNQVGYDGKGFRFKKAVLYIPRNPFAGDPDGYREITCDEYREYNRFVGETIPGTGTIENYFSKYNAKLYVMKQERYTAFFLSSPKGIYICNGGSIRKVGQAESLDRYYANFMAMVEKYITGLSPIRKALEKIASYVKSFGGEGRIHGLIVDIDFFNHIMINPYDGSLSIYYSPFLGIVKLYSNIGSLLHEQCPELERQYKALGNSKLPLTKSTIKNFKAKGLQSVDLKKGLYKDSRRMKALQRLFEKCILRDWNPEMEVV